VDDAPTLGQPRCRLLAREKRPFEVHGENAVELCFRHGADRLVEHDAGVVDQNVERS
jgi:hypothetical protein